ncbi:hypothetical protein AVEN_63320-1 [Araneus ventricosus]|uniref:Uncharacterized protein n=1 Tax=Araneus ventricosus TaxID=182803 RepID=A0A4Y2HBT0_ARAVE|nr:hypothetical protein AVEN_63320-1 [Araneus ventricosus]
MDSSSPFPLFTSLLVGDMNDRPFISPLRVPLMTTRPTVFSPLSDQQPAETSPTSIEVTWPVTAVLRVRELNEYKTLAHARINLIPSPSVNKEKPPVTAALIFFF